MKKVADSMTLNVRALPIDATLQDAHDLMETLYCRHVPIVYNDHVVGMVSDRDVLLRASVKNGQIKLPETPVNTLMSKEVEVCQSDDPIWQVAYRMVQLRLDSLPVIDPEGALIGIITTTDLLLILSRLREQDSPLLTSIANAMMLLSAP